jgi:hypothetical protein
LIVEVIYDLLKYENIVNSIVLDYAEYETCNGLANLEIPFWVIGWIGWM